MTTFHSYINTIDTIIDNVEKVIIGKRKEIKLSLVALLAGGHVLLEDVPGVGKTVFVRAMAKTIGGEFKRIQFTPDLLPSDVTGAAIYNQKTQLFEFKPGPIMANVVLADEINRTSPKTQSALLEALEEGNVTVDGETMHIHAPFFVLATQNPIEYAGTFPLPEAQLDRFLVKIQLGYPTVEEELELLNRVEREHPIDAITNVINLDQVIELQQVARDIFIHESVKTYIVNLIHATRMNRDIELGASPRATIALMKASQANALINGRDYVSPDDIKDIALSVLGHRLRLTNESLLKEKKVEAVLEDVIAHIRVPLASKKEKVK
ncbi:MULTISPECIES: AAA family ATPase [Shouchella]|uniref:ATPase chaperone, AAA-type, MoxR n=3 Tax=Bacillaceae TaxID=186817 RepID=A0A060M6F9_9BACI|nr:MULTISPECIES: MoxR family ATPase [Bacillaceae]AIC95674.1 ATPase chaperone, AAA-type, MoxR [Shouchella lehensis G1]KQL57079.1 AAA family ATPase [Alkalicoccobacillus plakortidis]MBG9783632.1 ATPase AAA [Shouchella lehensis]TES51419.1 MoxR family ATPase [Shouchella lehensis]